MFPRSLRLAVALALASGTAAAAVLAAWPAGAGTTGASLAEVRRATVRYLDPAAAVADGFVPTDACTADPGNGGMGYHYVNDERIADPAIVATEPEVLLYEARPDGTRRLVGVEWFAVDPDQDLTTDDGRPTVLGVPFEGAMPGHEPGMPVHFDLHAWIWKHNPEGTFATWNPRVGCGG